MASRQVRHIYQWGYRSVPDTYTHSLWKPIKGPLNDWPLGLCDARSVDFPRDTVASDVVFDGFVTENLQIMHSSEYKWYYLPDHNTWEALIFKSADSEESDQVPPGEIPIVLCYYSTC
jgi:hypothetical protein